MNNNKQSYYEKNKEKILKRQQEQRDKKYEGLIEGYDYICCKECGFRSSELATHIINKHNMTIDEYKLKHNVDSVKSQKSIDRVKGSNNPAYQHGGKFSPFSDKFIYAEITDKNKLIEKVKKTKLDNNTDTTKLGYWLKRTDGNEEKAKNLLSNRQSTFSLEKCIEKYGEEKGLQRWLDRQEKWHSNYKKSNFSKISQELFWEICKNLSCLENIHFAELNENKEKDVSGINNELKLKLEKVILPDFIDIKQKKVIEFDGVYWHGNVGHGNKSREKERDIILLNNGYKILHINENDFKIDKKGTVSKCIEFLKQ